MRSSIYLISPDTDLLRSLIVCYCSEHSWLDPKARRNFFFSESWSMSIQYSSVQFSKVFSTIMLPLCYPWAYESWDICSYTCSICRHRECSDVFSRAFLASLAEILQHFNDALKLFCSTSCLRFIWFHRSRVLRFKAFRSSTVLWSHS
jgi:hypothetical protein